MRGHTQYPSGWTSKRLKYIASYNDETLPESTDDLTEIDYVEISGVSLDGGIEEVNRMAFFEAPSRARRKVRKGDILISTVRTYLKAIATIGEASGDLIASTGFCVIRPGDEIDSTYLGWVAKSEPFVSEVVARSVGVSYPAINASELVNIEVPIPPRDVQQRIANFLDERTGHVDVLIRKMAAHAIGTKALRDLASSREKSLFGLLLEYRSALITDAVTGQIEGLR